jgi:hypothetical protein
MAYCDYMHCAICDCKVHYDASVDYDDYKRGCKPVVLCKDCMKTHKIVVQKIEVKDE